MFNYNTIRNIIYDEDHGHLGEQIVGEIAHLRQQLNRRPYTEQLAIIASTLASGGALASYLIRRSFANPPASKQIDNKPAPKGPKRLREYKTPDKAPKKPSKISPNDKALVAAPAPTTSRPTTAQQPIEVAPGLTGDIQAAPSSNLEPGSKDKVQGTNKSKNYADWVKKMDAAANSGSTTSGNDVTMEKSVVGSANTKGHETQVDPFSHVTRGPPHTATASLPYAIVDSFIDSDQHLAYDYCFRMNSVYDIDRTITQADANAGTGHAYYYGYGTDSTAHIPFWRSYYAAIYQFYSVLSCRWTFTYENLSTVPVRIYWMYIGSTYPDGRAQHEYMKFWPKCYSIDCQPKAVIVANDGTISKAATATAFPADADGNMVNGGKGVVHLAGRYKHGDFTREVKDDSEAAIWTAIGARPTLEENLLIRVKPIHTTTGDIWDTSSVTNSGGRIKAKINLTLEYLTQFKDPVPAIAYPVTSEPLTVSISSTVDNTNPVPTAPA